MSEPTLCLRLSSCYKTIGHMECVVRAEKAKFKSNAPLSEPPRAISTAFLCHTRKLSCRKWTGFAGIKRSMSRYQWFLKYRDGHSKKTRSNINGQENG